MMNSPQSSNPNLIAACEIVATAAGIFFPKNLSDYIYNSLDTIAEQLRFRFRIVKLSIDWWLTDNGPLLAFKKDTKTPCALIPKNNGTYQLIDPTQPTPQLITAEVANTLDEEAYFFYRTLPNKQLNLWDIWEFIKPLLLNELWKLAFISIVTSLMALAIPIATSNLFSYVIPNSDTSVLSQWIILLLAIAIGTLSFQLSQFIILLRLRFKLNFSLESATWDRLLNLPLSFFRQFSTGDLAQRSAGIDNIQQTLTNVIISHLLNSILAFFPLILMFYYDATLSISMMIFLVVFICIYVLAYRLQLKYQRHLLASEGLLSGRIQQLLISIPKLKTTCSEEYAFQRCTEKLRENITSFYKSGMLSIKMNVFSISMLVLAILIIYFITIKRGDHLSFGNFIGFISAFSIFSSAVFGITQDFLNAIATIPLYERIKSFYTTEPERIQTGIVPDSLSGTMSVENINFSYDPKIPVLQNISMEINAGEFVALVGASGCGKTTFIRLLLGLLNPESGKILYDNYDLATLNLKSVRNQIGVVLQNDSLLPATIFENICGPHVLTLEQAWQVARLAALDKDIEAMPMGMQTFVMEGGKTLSGGQRQRLMIARALARQPKILILDEASNALDNVTQATVQSHLSDLKLTRIIVTHRLSSIHLADKIYVLDKGKIIQSGNYKTLANQQGKFAELIEYKQLK